MSRESQTAVIDLLMRMRNSSASEIEIETETETDFSDKPETLSLSLSLSAHERKRREAKFVKRLVREHEQKQWRTKLRSGGNSNINGNGNGNGNPNQATTAAAKPTENTTTTVTTTTTTAKKKTTTALPKTTTNANEKVRIELVEAIFKDDGAKKVVVLPRSTTPAEILAKIAPAKLRLKTKPVRLFLKASSWSSSSSKTLLVELTDEADDLSGLDDGTTLYVTTTPAPGTTTTPAGGGDEATKKVVVLCGATGCGKSTQVPQFLIEGTGTPNDGSPQPTKTKTTTTTTTRRKYVVVTQPRRVAATSLANRVAEEQGSPPPGAPGSTVGYMVRLDRNIDETSCRIVYMTVGILLRMLVSESSVHERDVNTDFVLTLLKGLLFSPSPSPLSHLKLILMSATASSDLFVRTSTSTTAPGRGEETETSSGGNANSSLPKLSPRATDAIDNDFIRALIVKIVQQQQSDGELDAKPDNSNSNSNDTTRAFRSTGAILVFLPGQGEIESLAARLTDRNNTNSTCIVANQDICTVLKLHSSVSRSEQDKVFRRARIGTVKIVLATNIAETSLTIPDVSHVIDACLVKESRYNAAKRTPELVTVWTSKASLKQRAGRAGRTSAGTCWRLCSETFCNEELLPQTAPEMLRIPLDELVLQIGLLYEQRRDDYHSRILHLLQTSSQKGGSACTITVTGAARRTAFPPGAQPIKFLSMTPAPPPRTSLVQACKHLLEVGALHVVDDGGSNSNSNSNSEEMDTWYYRLTPLGYHLSRLPMDARVGKVLIVGCILGCLDGALTIAAALSCTKSCFYPRPTKEHIHAREILVQNGFGGAGWPGGTAKGDLIAVVATYRAWTETKKESQKWKFCKHHALDYATLRDMDRLRNQFGGLLADAGFAARPQNNRDSNRNNNKSNDDGSDDWCHKASDDALLTSCCLVAGLYPNICSLIRPRKGGPRGGRRGGRLYTNDGDECIPQSNSFQCKRVREAAQTGKDAYAVYHAKHRTLGTTAAANHKKGASEIFLTEVNFVSRFALLLFGGDLEIVQNAIVVDGWLKFKVSSDNNSDGDKDNDTRTPKADTVNNAVLILALREQLDQMILERVVSESSAGRDPEGTRRTKERHESIIQVVRKLLSEEG
eukprot:jgi/Psemu1/328623/estExt_fgenesh1_pg.C_17490002